MDYSPPEYANDVGASLSMQCDRPSFLLRNCHVRYAPGLVRFFCRGTIAKYVIPTFFFGNGEDVVNMYVGYVRYSWTVFEL